MALGDKKMEKGKLGLNRTLRKNAKSQLKKALDGGLVSAQETRDFYNNAKDRANAALKGQQVAINQAAAAAGSGSVNEAQLVAATERAQKQSADAAVNAASKAAAYKEGAESSRRQEAVANAENQRQEDARRRQQGTEYTTQALGTLLTSAQKLMG